MRKLLLLVFTQITLYNYHCQTTFQRTYGSPIDEKAHLLHKTKDGGYFMVAHYYNDSHVIKTDSLGNKQWSYEVTDEVSSLFQTQSGDYFICHGSRLLRLDASGNYIIDSEYGAGIFNLEFIQPDYDQSGFVIVGQKNHDIFLMKRDTNLNLVWNKIITLPVWNAGPKSYGLIQLKSDSCFYILNSFQNASNTRALLMTKIRRNGQYVWTKQISIGGTSSFYSYPSASLREMYNGNIMIGVYTTNSGCDFIELDSSGNTGNFQLRYIGVNYPQWAFVNSATGNGMYIASEGDDILLMKTDHAGNIQWRKSIGGVKEETSSFNSLLTSAVSTEINGCTILGTTKSFGAGEFDLYLLRTDSSGSFSCHSANETFPSAQQISASTSLYSVSTNTTVLTVTGFSLTTLGAVSDTSYDACSCVPPVASFNTYYPNTNCGTVYENSTWATNYLWDFGNGQTDTFYNPNIGQGYNYTDGNYLICLTVSNACGSHTLCDSINYSACPLAIEEQLHDRFYICPNPSSTQATIKSGVVFNNARLIIYDRSGRIVRNTVNVSGSEVTVNRDDFKAGIYFVRIEEPGFYSKTLKLIFIDQ